MSDSKPRMKGIVRQLASQLASIRSGTVDPGLVSSVRAVARSGPAKIGQIASVTRRGDRLLVHPFDPADGPAIVRALTESKISSYAMDRSTVAVTVPPLSGEQRAEVIRLIRKLGEEAKVAVRLVRQNARKQIAAQGRGSQRAVQEATDTAVAEIDRLVSEKIAEISA